MSKLSAYTKTGFQNLEEFNDLIGKMAKAEYCQVHFKDHPKVDLQALVLAEDQPDIWSKDYQGIVNKRTGKIAQVASPYYRILQNPMYFATISDVLEQEGFRHVHGEVTEIKGGEITSARLLFGDVIFEEPGFGPNLDVGASFTNSYNMTGAFGSAFYMRLVCTNGMKVKKIIPDCDFTKSHMAPSENELLEIVTKKIEGFVSTMLDSGVKLSEVIGEAMDDEIVFNQEAQLYKTVENIFETKKHARVISDLAMKEAEKVGENKFLINRWTLYNAATQYASHNPMTPGIQDQILYRAENRILSKPVEVPAMPLPIVV